MGHWGKNRNYKEYLGSPEWKQLSEFVKRQAGWKCQICDSPIDLVVHHRNYEGGANENGENCIAVCKSCHAKIHRKGGGEAGVLGDEVENIGIDVRSILGATLSTLQIIIVNALRDAKIINTNLQPTYSGDLQMLMICALHAGHPKYNKDGCWLCLEIETALEWIKNNYNRELLRDKLREIWDVSDGKMEFMNDGDSYCDSASATIIAIDVCCITTIFN